MTIRSTSTREYALLCIMSSHRETVALEKLGLEDRKKHKERADELYKRGWRALPTSEEIGNKRSSFQEATKKHGYFGVAYYRITNGEVEIVFAHRGTDFKKGGNVLADLQIVCQKQDPEIVHECAVEYTRLLFARSKVLREAHFSRITHTGFSLGGFTAAATCVAMEKYRSITYAVTFDAPGFAHLPGIKQVGRHHFKNFVLDPNLVNACNVHFGDLLQIMGLPELSLQLPASSSTSLAFELEFNNLGFSASPSLREDHTGEHLDEVQRSKIRLASSVTFFIELLNTIDIHNLDRLISYMEKNNMDEPLTREIYFWTTAAARFIEGPRPVRQIGFERTFGGDNLFSVLIDAAITVLGGSKDELVQMLWNATKVQRSDGQTVGLVGMGYQRSNNIVLFNDVFQRAFDHYLSRPEIVDGLKTLGLFFLNYFRSQKSEYAEFYAITFVLIVMTFAGLMLRGAIKKTHAEEQIRISSAAIAIARRSDSVINSGSVQVMRGESLVPDHRSSASVSHRMQR